MVPCVPFSHLYFSAMPSCLHLGAGWLVWVSTALSPSPGAFTCSLRGISSWHLKDCLIRTQWQSSVPLLTSVWAHWGGSLCLCACFRLPVCPGWLWHPWENYSCTVISCPSSRPFPPPNPYHPLVTGQSGLWAPLRLPASTYPYPSSFERCV